MRGRNRAEIAVPTGDAVLAGELVLPEGARGVVVVALAGGPGRHSPRVAALLEEAGIGTLVVDLLTAAEDAARHRLEVDLLARRLATTVEGLRRSDPGLAIGLFAEGSAVSAALVAAADPGEVSPPSWCAVRGPTEPTPRSRVRAPTLVVEGEDGELDPVARLAADWFVRHLG
jgi:hypothetical protein